MNALIASSTASINSAFTGAGGMSSNSVTIAQAIDFLRNWITYVIGAGFGVLQALMPYIVGLVVIGAIIYFLFRAFRFFRH